MIASTDRRQRRARGIGATLAVTVSALALPTPGAVAAAQTPSSTRASLDHGMAGLSDFVDGVVAQQIASREVAGAVVTVVYRGQVVLTRGYGFADVDRHIPVDAARTLFRPGSVSKLFTWTALMQQVERGKVDLDADVNTYLDFKIPPFRGSPVRIRDLLSHSPGMSDVGGFIFTDAAKVTPYAQWIKGHVPARLWAPGTEIAYSNFGAALAGYIVERVSGEAYPDYVERHIFAPLRMGATTFREPLPAALAPRMAVGYKYVGGQLVAKPPEFLSSIMPAGSATSSAPDIARFMMAMLAGGTLGGQRILKPETVALLERDTITNVPGLPGLAHGFLVEREAGPRLVGHAGNTGDFHSDLVIAPELGAGFFVSYTGGQGSSIARTELRDALIGRLFPQAPAPRWTGTEPPPLTGAYRANRRDYAKPADPAHDLAVTVAEPHLVRIVAEGVATMWEQIGPGEYQQLTGARAGGPFDRIKFYATPADPRLSFASMPYETFHLAR